MIRDPISDHLITPQNSALLVIDYQPAQVGAVRSMDRELLVKNIVSTVKLARLFGLPIVHSTVNVKSGRGKPTVSPLGELLKDDPPSIAPAPTPGGRRVRSRRTGHRTAETHLLRAVDGDLHGLPCARRVA